MEGEYGASIADETWDTNDSNRRTHVASSTLGRKRLDKITTEDCKAFAREIRVTKKRNVEGKTIATKLEPSNATRNRIVAFVSKLLSLAVDAGHVASNPATKLGLAPVAERENAVLAPEEAIALLNPSTRTDKVMALALWTGAGNKELRMAEWTHVDLKRRLWRIHGTKNRHRVRSVPLTQEAVDVLDSLPRRSDFLFTTEDGNQLTRRNLCRDFATRKKQLGLPAETRLQDLRGSYLSLILDEGATLREAMELLGHTKAETTLKAYARARQPRKAEAVERMAESIRKAKSQA